MPGGREYEELVGETKLVAGSASDIATAVRQRKASFAKKKHGGDGARARPQIAASEGLMENPAGGQKGSTRLCPKAAWEQGIDPEGRAAETCATTCRDVEQVVMMSCLSLTLNSKGNLSSSSKLTFVETAKPAICIALARNVAACIGRT